MPNWCENELTVTGPRADVDELLGRMKRDEHGCHLLLGSLLPMPDELEGTTSPSPLEHGLYDEALGRRRPVAGAERERLEALQQRYGHADWYSWQAAHWGVKWGDCSTRVTSHDPLVLDFDTPWSPPLAGLGAIAARYPSLTFDLRFVEPNMEFRGRAVWTNGAAATDRWEKDAWPAWDAASEDGDKGDPAE